MKNILTPIFIAASFLFLPSCDKVYTYEYRVNNMSDSTTMLVRYHFRNDSAVSTALLTPGEEKLLYITHHGVEGSVSASPVTRDIDSLVFIKGNTASPKNMLLDDNWIFSVSHNTGLYNATISDSEF